MKVILLGAGYATRLGELTKNKPKALLELKKDKPILNYIMENLEKVGEIDQAFLISNSKFYNQFCDWEEENKWRFPVKILDDGTYSNDTRLGAIGDIMYVLEKEKIHDDVIILATDNIFDFEFSDLCKMYHEKKTDMVIGKYFPNKKDIANKYAVAKLDKQNRIIDIVEKPAVPESNIAIFAVYIYTKETIKMFEDYKNSGYLMDAPGNFVSYLYTKKPVHTYIFEGNALDIGTPDSYEEAKKIVERDKNL